MERRNFNHRYDNLLPEYYPIKLIGAFISLDFIVGCSFGCSFCISRRHPSREELFKENIIIDNRVSPAKMHSWLLSMPAFRAGVQIRIGHDTDAGLQFDKCSKLINLIDLEHSIVYLTRKPFTSEEVTFFKKDRSNLLLKLTATPRSESLNITRNPLNLVRSVRSLNTNRLYWVVGPLVKDNLKGAMEILEALPKGSRLFLKTLNKEGLPHLSGFAPMSDSDYAGLEAFALEKGHLVTEWFCHSLAELGRGFFDVDKITGQPDGPKKERELGYCLECSSQELCYGELDLESINRQLDEQLSFLGLTLLDRPRRTGRRSFEITVQEPSSRGEETYLNNIIHPPVSININTREQGRSQGGSFCNIDRDVLRRWYENGFFAVGELNNKARFILEDILRIFNHQGISPRYFDHDQILPSGSDMC